MDTCVMCGKYVAEGDQVCWKCKEKLNKCSNCRHNSSTRCLTCGNWKYSTYKSKDKQ